MEERKRIFFFCQERKASKTKVPFFFTLVNETILQRQMDGLRLYIAYRDTPR